MRNIFYKVFGCLVLCLALLSTTSCSDDPDSSNYYTFTGEMMSDFLRNHADFSEYAKIVDRAGMMDLLSTYGKYTCFAPTNEAINKYLKSKGLTSVDQLTDADCDTIARSHLVDNMYATSEMSDGTLPTSNMLNRYIEIGHGLDADSNAVVRLNRSANVIFESQDDSVENGIMQPIDGVLLSNSRMLPDIMESNPKISLFYSALKATGLVDTLYQYRDESYNSKLYPRYKYISHVNKETATVPDYKQQGYTAFVPTDSVLRVKYSITSLEDLYKKACEIYDPVYPEDVNQSYHAFSELTNPKNPLNRFIRYHILTRDVIGYNMLTPRNDIGIMTTKMNPEDWYETLLPHTMMKFERLTVLKYVGPSNVGMRYINRRYDDNFQITGTQVMPTIESEYANRALNGMYFYVDDILAFSTQTRDIVDNCRIRMDMSTIFPELMTENIRQNGDVKKQDPDYDETAKYGRNYYFPNGYLKNVLIKSGTFVYRRPHDYYDSYEGDEMNMFGDYDITFKIPPVPYEGEWQIRLGYAQEPTRGIAQVYFDGVPQGIPLDMTKKLDDASILGASFKADYSTFTDLQLSADQKALKNKGYYRGAAGGYRYNSGTTTRVEFAKQANTFRIVLCTVHIDPKKDHYLRVRCVSSKKGNDNEFMLDYLELVPKSIYGVTDEGKIEDML